MASKRKLSKQKVGAPSDGSDLTVTKHSHSNYDQILDEPSQSAGLSVSGMTESTVHEQATDDELADVSSSVTAKESSMRKSTLYLRRFARNKLADVGVVIFLLLVLASIVGPHLTQWSYSDPDFLSLATPPDSEHWFGTSDSGNDLFAQTVHGLGRSLTIALVVSVGVTVLSAVIGCAAALWGGATEKIILGFIHFMLAIPSFLIIALLVSGSGGDWKLLIVVLVAFGWIYPARVIWSMALSVKENDYVRAASYMGVSKPRIVIRHLVPNIGSLLVIQFALGIPSTVMTETGLSFLGLGVKLPDVSLGTLLTVGTGALDSAPWQFYFPAAVLTLLTISMAFIADGLRDALDPNSSAGGNA